MIKNINMKKLNFNIDYDYDIDSKEQSSNSDIRLIKNLPWIEKFRPSTLDEIISNKPIVDTLKGYIQKQYLPHLLFCGPSGTGKTSIIVACATELYGKSFNLMTLHINASEERGIEIVRNKIKDFVMSKNFSSEKVSFKLIILDEADAMTTSAQGMLRRMIEDYTQNARFCLICNKLKNIDQAIQSRCTNFRFSPLLSDDIKQRLISICFEQSIPYDSEGLDLIINISNGDMRKVLNILQSINMGYNLISYDTVSNCTGYPHYTDIIKIYKILNTSKLNDSYDKILKIFNSKQYILLDIIKELHKLLLLDVQNKKISIDRFKKIILQLKFIEQKSLVSDSNELLLTSLIAAFY
jgi:replication factor C subunit 3/5